MKVLFQNDARYRRFLAVHPGVWGEVGVIDDPRFLSTLLDDRRALGLPDLVVATSRRRKREARK